MESATDISLAGPSAAGAGPPPAGETGGGSRGDLAAGWIAGVLALYAVLACGSSFLFPIFEAPDEPSHFLYSRLVANGMLPLQTDPERSAHAEGFNPPLYYFLTGAVLALCGPDRGSDVVVKTTPKEQFLLATARARSTGDLGPDYSVVPPRNPRFIWWRMGRDPNWFAHPQDGPFQPGPLLAIHFMRLVSVLCGLATLSGVVLLARQCLPGCAAGQLAALCAVAFNPQFVYITSVLNSDNLVTALATLALWQLAAALRRRHVSTRHAAVLGILLGLGTLAKTNMLFLAGCALPVLWLVRSSCRTFLKNVSVLGLCVLLIAGWFFIRNVQLFGALDPFGWEARARIDPVFAHGRGDGWEFLSGRFFLNLFRSYWGHFGWLTILMPLALYVFYGGLSLLALLSPAALAIRKLRLFRAPIVLCGAAVGLNLFALVLFNMRFPAEQGRLLYPSVGAAAVLIGIGLEITAARLSARGRFAGAAALAAVLIGLVVFVQSSVIYPVYF